MKPQTPGSRAGPWVAATGAGCARTLGKSSAKECIIFPRLLMQAVKSAGVREPVFRACCTAGLRKQAEQRGDPLSQRALSCLHTSTAPERLRQQIRGLHAHTVPQEKQGRCNGRKVKALRTHPDGGCGSAHCRAWLPQHHAPARAHGLRALTSAHM